MQPLQTREFVGNRLPKGGLKSSFLGTWASFFNNTTVDAPAESNRFDMRLEKDFGEIVEMLGLQVADRSMSSVDATQRLKEHLKGFYATSVENLTIRLEQIEEFISLLNKLRSLEESLCKQEDEEKLTDYAKTATQATILFDILLEPKAGCPSCKEIKTARNDFSFLRRFADSKDPLTLFTSRSNQLSTKTTTHNLLPLKKKHELFLNEATFQQQGVEDIGDCVIQDFPRLFFGVLENGERLAPSEQELTEQSWKIFKIASPLKKEPGLVKPGSTASSLKRKRDGEDDDQVKTARRRLSFLQALDGKTPPLPSSKHTKEIPAKTSCSMPEIAGLENKKSAQITRRSLRTTSALSHLRLANGQLEE